MVNKFYRLANIIAIIIIVSAVYLGAVDTVNEAAKNYILGNFELAKAQLEQILDKDPNNQQAVNLYNELIAEMKDLGLEIKERTKAVETTAPPVKSAPPAEIYAPPRVIDIEEIEDVTAEPDVPVKRTYTPPAARTTSEIEAAEPYRSPSPQKIPYQKYEIIPDPDLKPAISDHTVHFALRVLNAKKVSLVGSFNQWDKDANPLERISEKYWETRLYLSRGTYYYKYCIDDEYIIDPNNDRVEQLSSGGLASVVVVRDAGRPEAEIEAPKTVPSPKPEITVPEKKIPVITREPAGSEFTIVNYESRYQLFNTGAIDKIGDLNLSPRVFTDGKAQFSLYAPHAKQVMLVGDFNNWQPSASPMVKTASGIWVATIELRTGSYGYNFVVDGTWVIDPDNLMYLLDKYGNKNSLLNVELGASRLDASPLENRTLIPAMRGTVTLPDAETGEKAESTERVLKLFNRLKNIQEKLSDLKHSKKSTRDPEESVNLKKPEPSTYVPKKKSSYDVDKDVNVRKPVTADKTRPTSSDSAKPTTVRTIGSYVPAVAKICGVTVLPFQAYGFTTFNYWQAQRVTDYLKNRIAERENCVLLSEPVNIQQGYSVLDYLDMVKGDVVVAGSMLSMKGELKVSVVVVDRRLGREKFNTYEFTGKEDKLDLLLVAIESSILSDLNK